MHFNVVSRYDLWHNSNRHFSDNSQHQSTVERNSNRNTFDINNIKNQYNILQLKVINKIERAPKQKLNDK